MNNRKKSTDRLLSLLDNNLVQFLLGIFLIALATQIVDTLSSIHLKLVLKTFGYGVFYYLATPFIIHWLNYVSADKLTKLKIAITICVVGIYSYVFWDSYFFYKLSLGELLFSPSLI